MAKSASDTYYAVIFFGGGSSWQYAPTKEQAVKGVVKIFLEDWRPKPGAELKVNIFDVSHIPDGTPIYSDDFGVWAELEGGDQKVKRIEIQTVRC